MSKLEELLQKYCPDGVEYKNIGSVFETVTDYVAAGSFADIKKNVKYLSEPDYAMLIRTMDIKNGYKSSKPVYIDQRAYEYLWRVNLNGEGIVLPNIGNCGEVYYLHPDALPYTRCALAPNAIWLRSKSTNIKFMYYVLQAPLFQKQLAKIVSPTGQTKFNKTDLKNLEIPVPPLPIQQEIVRILDSFTLLSTELAAELAAELTARKNQYEYYRDVLLNNDEWETVCLKDVAEFKTGSKPEKIEGDVFDGCFEYVNAGTTCSGYVSEPNCSGDVVTTPSRGQGGIGFVGYQNNPFWLGPLCYRISSKNTAQLKNKYLYYYLANRTEDILARKKEGGVPALNASDLGTIRVYIPSLVEQERIILALDNFESICSDLNVGILAEIEARQKQYEYYRDKLLSFKRLS